MQFQHARYIGSYPHARSLPDSTLPEYCFWGRSNVGKSSLINYLTQRKELALISSTPGKTINFNFFLIDDRFHLVDLPGYGYARVSRSSRQRWNIEIEKYLQNRKNLICVFLLIDISIAPQKTDLDHIRWMGENHVPFAIIFTKSDKCKKAELKFNINRYEELLKKDWENLPEYFCSSSDKYIGKEEILKFMSLHLSNFEKTV